MQPNLLLIALLLGLTRAASAGEVPAPPLLDIEDDDPAPSVATRVAGSGDIFVGLPVGALLFLDGEDTGRKVPAMLEGVDAGPHVVRVDLGCSSSTVELDVRPGVVERIEPRMEPAMGVLALSIEPASAVVRLDSGPVPASSSPIEVACGTHSLETSAPGFLTDQRTVVIPVNDTVSLTIQLSVEQAGTLALTVEPLDARVWVDGTLQGSGPMTVEHLSVGMHEVVAKKSAYEDARSMVEVRRAEISRLSLELQPREAWVSRSGMDRVPWLRVGANSVATGASLAMGAVALSRYSSSSSAYETYLGLTYADAPGAWYQDEVARPRTQAYMLGAGAGVGLGLSAVLWATMPRDRGVKPVVGPQGVGVVGTL